MRSTFTYEILQTELYSHNLRWWWRTFWVDFVQRGAVNLYYNNTNNESVIKSWAHPGSHRLLFLSFRNSYHSLGSIRKCLKLEDKNSVILIFEPFNASMTAWFGSLKQNTKTKAGKKMERCSKGMELRRDEVCNLAKKVRSWFEWCIFDGKRSEEMYVDIWLSGIGFLFSSP